MTDACNEPGRWVHGSYPCNTLGQCSSGGVICDCDAEVGQCQKAIVVLPIALHGVPCRRLQKSSCTMNCTHYNKAAATHLHITFEPQVRPACLRGPQHAGVHRARQQQAQDMHAIQAASKRKLTSKLCARTRWKLAHKLVLVPPFAHCLGHRGGSSGCCGRAQPLQSAKQAAASSR